MSREQDIELAASTFSRHRDAHPSEVSPARPMSIREALGGRRALEALSGEGLQKQVQCTIETLQMV